jgi:tetratricopeptide (TPR) repeat protein
MVRPARLLRFAALSALLVPVTQLAGGLQPLWAVRSVETPQIPGFFGAGDTRHLIATLEPWDLYILGGATRDRVLVKHPVPDGLWGVGDRFLNGSGAGNQITHQEPVPLAVTQIPGFFGAGDPWRVGTTQEPWDLDPLKGKKQKAGLPLPAELGKADPLLPQTGVKQDGTAALEVEGQLEDGDEVLQDGSLYDLHTFDGEAGQFIEIRLSSDAFDTYLILLGPDGEQIAENDDGGEGLNSIIYIQLPQTGRYSMIANAYEVMGRGRYRLTVAEISAEDYQQGQENARVSAEADRLLYQGLQQYNRSQFREAITSWARALELYRAAGNRLGEGRSLGNLGIVYNNLGQYERAIDFHEQALALFRELVVRAEEVTALGNLGIAYRNLGRYPRAIDFYEQALTISRDIGDRAGEGRALGNSGNAYFNLGQYERAIDFYEQALALFRGERKKARSEETA